MQYQQLVSESPFIMLYMYILNYLLTFLEKRDYLYTHSFMRKITLQLLFFHYNTCVLLTIVNLIAWSVSLAFAIFALCPKYQGQPQSVTEQGGITSYGCGLAELSGFSVFIILVTVYDRALGKLSFTGHVKGLSTSILYTGTESYLVQHNR